MPTKRFPLCDARQWAALLILIATASGCGESDSPSAVEMPPETPLEYFQRTQVGITITPHGRIVEAWEEESMSGIYYKTDSGEVFRTQYRQLAEGNFYYIDPEAVAPPLE